MFYSCDILSKQGEKCGGGGREGEEEEAVELVDGTIQKIDISARTLTLKVLV